MNECQIFGLEVMWNALESGISSNSLKPLYVDESYPICILGYTQSTLHPNYLRNMM